MKRRLLISRLFVCPLITVLMGVLIAFALPDAVRADGTFTVNSGGDGNPLDTRDAVLTLREAIALANNGAGSGAGLGRTLTNGEKAQISGGCTFGGGDDNWTITGGCGVGFFDYIGFDPEKGKSSNSDLDTLSDLT